MALVELTDSVYKRDTGLVKYLKSLILNLISLIEKTPVEVSSTTKLLLIVACVPINKPLIDVNEIAFAVLSTPTYELFVSVLISTKPKYFPE